MTLRNAAGKGQHEQFNLCSKQCSKCLKIFTRTADLVRHLATTDCFSNSQLRRLSNSVRTVSGETSAQQRPLPPTPKRVRSESTEPPPDDLRTLKRSRKQRKSEIVRTVTIETNNFRAGERDRLQESDSDEAEATDPPNPDGTPRDDLKSGPIQSINFYDCQYCRKSFHRARDRNDHVNYIHKKIRYKCPVCQKLLSTERNVKRHMRVHHEIPTERSNLMTIETVQPDTMEDSSEWGGSFKVRVRQYLSVGKGGLSVQTIIFSQLKKLD